MRRAQSPNPANEAISCTKRDIKSRGRTGDAVELHCRISEVFVGSGISAKKNFPHRTALFKMLGQCVLGGAGVQTRYKHLTAFAVSYLFDATGM